MSLPDHRSEISCDLCVLPGTCCKAFPLNHFFPFGTHPNEVEKLMTDKGLPFKPLRRIHYWACEHEGKSGQWVEQWLFSCPKLGADGRCTIYEDRPDTCKSYEAGTDHMCVHVRGMDGRPVLPQKEIAS